MNDGDEKAWIREGKVGYTADRTDRTRWRPALEAEIRSGSLASSAALGRAGVRLSVRASAGREGRTRCHARRAYGDASFGEIAYLKT